MATEVDLTRTLNTLAQTLNDQKLGEFEADRIQELANGATGGEFKFAAYGSGTSGELREGSLDGEPVAHLSLDRGKWMVERVPEARKSVALQQAEQERESQTQTEYQKPVRGRLAIWKKYLAG